MKGSKVLLTFLFVAIPAGENLIGTQKVFHQISDNFQRHLWFATAARMGVKIPSLDIPKTELISGLQNASHRRIDLFVIQLELFV